jgi:hypothetical protein
LCKTHKNQWYVTRRSARRSPCGATRARLSLPPHQTQARSYAAPARRSREQRVPRARAAIGRNWVPHLPRALMRAVARGRAGVCLSSALRARVHANPPDKPPRTRAPCAPRPRAPSRAPQNVREAPPARTALTRSAVPEHTADVRDSDGQTAAPAN